ncbi:hypothetical protein QMP26_08820 [Enterocloster clostridioformis]|uniref:hypothetical protein n=1 Tax=Enterocloster clostridioformis TaxID=1531 RepID=UPI002674B416|nr:hypothetical protein [Enterocloster clostridioformis]
MGKILGKITDRISDVMTPVSARLMSFQFIAAISETMQAIMPIILIGSFGCLVANLDVGP